MKRIRRCLFPILLALLSSFVVVFLTPFSTLSLNVFDEGALAIRSVNLSPGDEIKPLSLNNQRLTFFEPNFQSGQLQGDENFWISQANGESEKQRFGFLHDMPIFYLGAISSLLAGLATGVGGLPILLIGQVSNRLEGFLLGGAAGVMLAATSFSLLIPGIEAAANENSDIYAATVAVAGTLLGGSFLWLGHHYFPYEKLIYKPVGSDINRLKGIWLFVIAIAIHNFPEGLAVGVGFGGGNIGNGLALAIGIGLQNIPEGLAVAISLITERYSRGFAFWIAVLTGLVEPIGGLLGAGFITLGQAILPWGMAFAAGAMLFVVADEIIPESQRLTSGSEATIGVLIGFVLMMFLDVTLG